MCYNIPRRLLKRVALFMTKYKLLIMISIILCLIMAGSIYCGNPVTSEPSSPDKSPPSATTTPPAPAQPAEETAQPPAPPPATSSGELTVISKIIGDVRIMKAGESEWIPTFVGTMLKPGDSVKTLIGSNALITFFDGSTIYLNELTEIKINEVSVTKDTGAININIWQEIGKTRSRVNKLVDPASRYEVQTSSGSAVARGSVADITVFWDGTTYILNVEGNWYAYVDGQWIPIPPGTQLNLSPNVPPGVPFIPPNLLEQGSGGGSGGYNSGSGQGGKLTGGSTD